MPKSKKTDGKKILFVASECQPFITTGGLADVVGSLPKAIKKQNPSCDVRVILPLYSDISSDWRINFEYVGNVFTNLSWRKQYCGVFKYEKDGVVYYFFGHCASEAETLLLDILETKPAWAYN